MLTVLYMRVFGLVSNYNAKAKASESWRRHIENQPGIWESCVGGLGEVPPKCLVFYCVHNDKMAKQGTNKAFISSKLILVENHACIFKANLKETVKCVKRENLF